MTRKTLAFVAAIAAATLLATATVDAQPGPGWGMGQGQGMGRGMGLNPNAPWRERFAAIDTNGDGVITKDEVATQAEMVFAAMDADSSGALTKEEYMGVRMGAQRGYNPARVDAMQKQKAARFAPMDRNGDGTVTLAEFAADHQAMFTAMDRDGDGRVTPAEFRGRHW
ncbi:MAG: hypothetical protein GX458_00755 [Phyllobacteriaceae bacterium]|nr:hypothetical protein [Phyllobacteriaceae bacterium]